MVFNVNLTPPTQPPTQPGKYQASKIKQFMLSGSCQSLGVKLKTVFSPNLNNLNSSLKAIIDSKNWKFNESQFNIACTSSLLLYMLIANTIFDPFQTLQKHWVQNVILLNSSSKKKTNRGSVPVIMLLGTPPPSKSCNIILVYMSYIDTYGSVPIEITMLREELQWKKL